MHTNVFSKYIKLCLLLWVDDDGILKFISLEQNIICTFKGSNREMKWNELFLLILSSGSAPKDSNNYMKNSNDMWAIKNNCFSHPWKTIYS